MFSVSLSGFQVLVMLFPCHVRFTHVTRFCSQLHVITDHFPTVFSFLVHSHSSQNPHQPFMYSHRKLSLVSCLIVLIKVFIHSLVFIAFLCFFIVLSILMIRLCRAFCSCSLSWLKINLFWFRKNCIWVLPYLAPPILTASSSKGPSLVGSSEDEIPSTPPAPCISAAPSAGTRGLPALNYTSYMARLLAAEELTPLSSPGASSTEASPTIRGNVRHACRLNKHNIVIKEWCMFSQRILQLSCNKEQDRRSFLLTAMTLHDFFTLTCN